MTALSELKKKAEALEHVSYEIYKDFLELIERLESAERDAARYRWLRHQSDEVFNADYEICRRFGDEFFALSALVDDVVDAAMTREKALEELSQSSEELGGYVDASCAHPKATIIYAGDGPPVEFCPDCGINRIAGPTPSNKQENQG